MRLRPGDWVEVRSKEEILRSLDKNGRLQELPFMPQMFQYCGRQFQIYKSAHKTCDTVNPLSTKWVADAVHLNLRCDGKAYGGCQAGCLLFWKEAWLKPVKGTTASMRDLSEVENPQGGCSEQDVSRATSNQGQPGVEETRCFCQATELPSYTTYLSWWNVRQYIEDYTSGNVSLWEIVCGFTY